MPGTVVRDALAPNLLTGSTLNAAGTTTGTAVEVGWPGECSVEIVTGTVTGTSPTLAVEIQGSEVANFATFVSYGRFTNATATGQTRHMALNLQSRYVRASVVVGGTTPVFTGTTAYLRLPHDREVYTVSTA